MNTGLALLLAVTTLAVIAVAGYLYMLQGNPFPTDTTLQNHYRLLRHFESFCVQHELSFFATAGTLLGAIRHGGMIPWDNDIDLGMLEDQYHRLESMEPELRQYGLFFQKKVPGMKGMCKIYSIEMGGPDRAHWHRFPVIDVFQFLKEETDKTIRFSNPKFRKLWPSEWYTYDEIQEPFLYTFGPIGVWGPSDPETVCRRQWGPDWRIPKLRKMFQILHPFQAQTWKEQQKKALLRQ